MLDSFFIVNRESIATVNGNSDTSTFAVAQAFEFGQFGECFHFFLIVNRNLFKNSLFQCFFQARELLLVVFCNFAAYMGGN